MADSLTREQRGALMARVRGKDTAPELMVRSMAHAMGFRFRLHRRDLPGRPDLVFPKRRAVIFVHGCFWHGHVAADCKLYRVPKTNVEFWTGKVAGNRARDDRAKLSLEALGWKVLVVWECELRDKERVKNTIRGFLSGE